MVSQAWQNGVNAVWARVGVLWSFNLGYTGNLQTSPKEVYVVIQRMFFVVYDIVKHLQFLVLCAEKNWLLPCSGFSDPRLMELLK